MMRSLIAALLFASFHAAAQTQVPNVFEDGTPASAAEVNENFQYVLENASGGCSATQQDNSVLIECADGTSGVIAGAGSAVIIPEGVLGEAPDISVIPVGDFYWEDGNGVVLARATGNMGEDGVISVTGTDGYDMLLRQNDETQTVTLWTGQVRPLFYTQPDCAGVPFGYVSPNGVIRYDGSYRVRTSSDIYGEQTLVMAVRLTDSFDINTGQWVVSPCENFPEPQLSTVDYFHVTYDPPAEWLNAAYPLTLVQKP